MRCIECMNAGDYKVIGSPTNLICRSCSNILFFEPEELLDPVLHPDTAMTQERRDGQIAIANTIYNALMDANSRDMGDSDRTCGLRKPYMIEGGVGVGKTLGYICGFLPVLYTYPWGREEGPARGTSEDYQRGIGRRLRDGGIDVGELPWMDDSWDFRIKHGRVPLCAVISTESKGLQAQAAEDYRRARAWLQSLYLRHGINLQMYGYLLQGKQNYVCMKKFNDIKNQPDQMFQFVRMRTGIDLHRHKWKELRQSIADASVDLHGEDLKGGTIASVQSALEDDGVAKRLGIPPEAVAAAVASFYPKNCSSPTCEERGCSYQRIMHASREDESTNPYTNVVIVNHAYVAACAKMGDATVGAQLLGRADVQIYDEAHKLTEIVLSAYRTELKPDQIGAWLRRLSAYVHGARAESSDMDSVEYGGYGDILDRFDRMVAELQRDWSAAWTSALELYEHIRAVGHAVPGAQEGVIGAFGATTLLDPPSIIVPAQPDLAWNMSDEAAHFNHELSNVIEGMQSLMTVVTRQLGLGSQTMGDLHGEGEAIKEGIVSLRSDYYFRRIVVSGDDRIMMASPNSVGSRFDAALKRGMVVMTSGTLTSSGGAEDVTVGMKRILPSNMIDAPYLYAPSPFDYENNAVAYIPTDRGLIPPVSTASAAVKGRWYASVASHILEVLQLTRGFGFVLCTSIADMEALYRGMKTTLQGLGMSVSHQKMHSDVRSAVRWYSDCADTALQGGVPGPIMFGVSSMWTGVSMSGDALQAVIIPKMPFPAPKGADYMQAEKEFGNEVFDMWSLPEAIKQLRQGEGRLIRTSEDKGIFALLDGRIHIKGYGRTVMMSLQTRKNTCSTVPDLQAKWLKIKTS